jgi:3-hydroxyisobutyrate dehydrogenase-like beta-hydroxyacid dehydrogenase
MLLGILMAGTAEALNLGVLYGLDPPVLSDIMSKSSDRNWALEVYNPWPGVMEGAPASRDYSGGFGTTLMLKDLGLAQHARRHLRPSPRWERWPGSCSSCIRKTVTVNSIFPAFST